MAQGLVQARQVGQAREYTLNDEHLAYRALAAAFDAFAPRADLDDRLRGLVRDHLPVDGSTSLAYFGSLARGGADVDSDIDLLLIVPDDTAHETTDELVDDLEIHGQRWTGNEIQVYAAHRADLDRAVAANDPIVAEWRRDAVTILGPSIQHLVEAAQ